MTTAPRSDRAPCVQIRVTWGASTLDVAHLDVPRRFTLADLRAALGPGCPLGEEVDDLPILEVDPRGRPVVVLAGDRDVETTPRSLSERTDAGELAPLAGGVLGVPLEVGDGATIRLGPVVVVLAALDAAPPARFGRSRLDRRTRWVAAGVVVAHAAALLALSRADEPASDATPSAEQIAEMQRLLRVAAERDGEAAVEEPDGLEGGTGTRARGEEGSLGTRSRYGVRGPSDPHVARQHALREAQEFGMIGLLGSGAGGAPDAPVAPWGRDEGAGLGPVGTIGHGAGTGTGQGLGAGAARSPSPSARGNMWGDAAGDARGASGLGLSGLGGGGARDDRDREPAIDPNGRFATTYRPGAGHLASFEAALARGVLPEATRAIVADVGASGEAPIAAPTDRALAWRADLDRGLAAPGGGPSHLRIALRSSDRGAGRPRLSVHLVFDTSGSMDGEAMTRAKEAARALVDRLAPTDDFSLVSFSTDARVEVPDGLVGPRRAAIRAVIDRLAADGGTNMAEGLRLGYLEARAPAIPEDAQRVVLLMSDGRPNGGTTSRESLARAALDAFQDGIQTSAFGLGADFDGALMSQIASEGAGGYYYVAQPDHIASALATELDRRLDPVAGGVEVRVRLKDDVRLLGVYGSRRLGGAEAEKVRAQEVAVDVVAAKRSGIARDRQDDAEGGMRFFMPSFGRDDAHAILLRLDLPAGVGERGIASIEVKYKDLLAKKNVVEERKVSARFADSDAASAASADPSVARAVQRFAAGEALAAAARKVASGDRQGALAIVDERAGILDHAAVVLGDPTLGGESARLRRLRAFLDPSGPSPDTLALAMLVETAGQARLR